MRRVRGMKVGARAVALLLAGGLALAGCASSEDSSSGTADASGSGAATGKALKVGIAFDTGGRGDKSFNDSAYAGVENYVSANSGSEVKDLAPNSDASNRAELLTQLADGGYNPIIAVGFAYADDIADVAKQYSDVSFAIIDSTGIDVADNVTGLQFAANEGSFLGGVAAALKTTTKSVGFVGGVETPLIQSFQAGFDAGVKAVDPSITITDKYISPAGDFSGFSDPAKGKIVAQGIYDDGADIVYAAAGGSGIGVFQAAVASKKLAIGVDSDQYESVDDASLQPVILTSVLKRVDVAVQSYLGTVADGTVKGGTDNTYDLKNQGVGLATSGGFIEDIQSQIDDYSTKIANGEITVPTTP